PGTPGEPPGQRGGRQRRYLNVAECRIDVRLGAVARIHTTLAVDFEELEIAFDGGSHRQRACDAIGKLRATHHARTSLVLRLRKTEDDCPIGIAKVVGGADLLDYVAPASDVVARNPCPCDSWSSL